MLKFFTKGDKILIVAILLINSFPLFIPMISAEPNVAKTININVDGKLVETFPLHEDSQSKFLNFSFSFDGKIYDGKLETKDGKVRLHRLPKEISPKSIHADMGWISKENQMIVALPVKMIISVRGSVDESIDSISY